MKIIKNIALSTALLMPVIISAKMTDTVKKYAPASAKTSLHYGRKVTAEALEITSDITKVASLLPIAFATCTAGSIMGNALISENPVTSKLKYIISQIASNLTQTDISFKSPFRKTIEQIMINMKDKDPKAISSCIQLAAMFSMGSYLISRLAKTAAYHIKPASEKKITNKYAKKLKKP